MRASLHSRNVIAPERVRLSMTRTLSMTRSRHLMASIAFVVRLHLPFRSRQRQIANLRARRVLDLDDRLVGTLLDDAPGPEKAAAFTMDADLLRDRVITCRNEDHPPRIGIERGLEGRIVRHGQLCRHSLRHECQQQDSGDNHNGTLKRSVHKEHVMCSRFHR